MSLHGTPCDETVFLLWKQARIDNMSHNLSWLQAKIMHFAAFIHTGYWHPA